MQKTLKNTLIFLLTGCLALTAALTLSVSAEESESVSTIYADAMYPAHGYGSFGNIVDMAEDGGRVYVLEYTDSGARITVYEKGKRVSVISDNLDAPESIRSAGGKLFIRDGQAVKIYQDGVFVGQIAVNAMTFKSMDADGVYLYVLENGAIKRYDVTDAASIPEPLIVLLSLGSGEKTGDRIAASGNYIYYFINSFSGSGPQIAIRRYDMVGGETEQFSQYDKFFSAVNMSAANGLVAINTMRAVKIIDASSKQPAVIAEMSIGDGEAVAGNILSVKALQINDSGEIYVADEVARAVQRFQFAEEAQASIGFDGLYIGSFSGEAGRFFMQADIYEHDTKKYILDSGNRRLQIFDGDKISVVPLVNTGDEELLNIAVLSSDSVFISSKEHIYKVSGETVETVYTGTAIGSLFVTLNSVVYFSDGKGIYQLGTDAPVITASADITAFAVDLAGDTVYAATHDNLIRYDGEIKTEFGVPTIVDVDIDFSDNLFVLTADGAVAKYSPLCELSGKVTVMGIAFQDGVKIEGCTADRIAVSRTTGEILLNFAAKHAVAVLDKKHMSAATELDVPHLVPTVDILDGLSNNGESVVANINAWPSTIIYPFDDEVKKQEVYPEGYAHDKIVKVPETTTVLVLEELGGYYYILYANRAGFILKNSVTIQNNVEPPFTDGQVLHSDSTVYKLPTTVGNKTGGDMDYAYSCGTLVKGTVVTVLDTVCDWKDSNGVLWYRILYGKDTIAYIARINVTQNIEWSDNFERRGKIKAEITAGEVSIYDTPSESAVCIAKMKDASIIKVLKDYGNGWLYIEGSDTDGILVHGYVLSQYVTGAPMTTAQIVGLCLIISTAVLLVAALIVITAIRRRNRRVNVD